MMATDDSRPASVPDGSVQERVASSGRSSHGPVNVFLLRDRAAVAGARRSGCSSRRSAAPADNSASGLVDGVLTDPAQLTFDNYRTLLDNARHGAVVLEHRAHHGAGHPAGGGASRRSRRTRSPGSTSRAATGCSWSWSALLVVPIQVALIPVARLYGTRDLRHDPGRGAVPRGVRPAVRDLPAAQLLRGHPAELLEAARMDGARRADGVRAGSCCRSGCPAIASLGDLPVPVGVERPARRAGVRRHLDQPLTVAIREQTAQFGTNIDVIAPAAFLSLIVPLVVFFAFQRYFVQGCWPARSARPGVLRARLD